LDTIKRLLPLSPKDKKAQDEAKRKQAAEDAAEESAFEAKLRTQMFEANQLKKQPRETNKEFYVKQYLAAYGLKEEKPTTESQESYDARVAAHMTRAVSNEVNHPQAWFNWIIGILKECNKATGDKKQQLEEQFDKSLDVLRKLQRMEYLQKPVFLQDEWLLDQMRETDESPVVTIKRLLPLTQYEKKVQLDREKADAKEETRRYKEKLEEQIRKRNSELLKSAREQNQQVIDEGNEAATQLDIIRNNELQSVEYASGSLPSNSSQPSAVPLIANHGNPASQPSLRSQDIRAATDLEAAEQQM